MHRPSRLRAAVGALLLTVVSLIGVASTAAPAAAAPPPTSQFEKVKLDGGLSMGEPIELAVLPDGKVLYINRGTSAGGGQVRLYNPATGPTTVALTARARRPVRGRPDRHHAAPAVRHQPLGVPVLLPGGDAAGQPDLPVHLQPEHQRARPGQRGHDHRVADRAAAVLPLGRLDDLGQQQQPLLRGRRQHQLRRRLGRHGADRRAHQPRRAVRRPAHLGQHQRPAREDQPDPPGEQRHLHDPGRQPLRAGHGADPARDLHHGRPQPVPDLGRQDQQHPLLGRGRPGRRRDRSPTAARPPTTSTTAPPAPGNYGWPYCGGPNVAYNDWDFAANAPRGWFPCGGVDRPGQQLAAQHRPAAAAADPAARWCGSSTAAAREWPALDNPGGCGSPNHAEVYHYNPNLDLGRQVAAVLRQQAAHHRVLPQLGQGGPVRQRQPGAPATRPSSSRSLAGHAASCTRSTWSSARTARSTCWSTATATSPATPPPASTKSTTWRADGRRSRSARPTPTTGWRRWRCSFSSAGSSDPDGNPLTYAWDFDNNGTTDSTAANPSFTYTTNGDKRARLTVNDGTGRSGTTARRRRGRQQPAGGQPERAARRRPVRLERQPDRRRRRRPTRSRARSRARTSWSRAALGPPGARARGGPGHRLRLHRQHRSGARRPRLGAVLRAARQLHRQRRDRLGAADRREGDHASARSSGRPSTTSRSTARRSSTRPRPRAASASVTSRTASTSATTRSASRASPA